MLDTGLTLGMRLLYTSGGCGVGGGGVSLQYIPLVATAHVACGKSTSAGAAISCVLTS
jgi:hypothetical protein